MIAIVVPVSLQEELELAEAIARKDMSEELDSLIEGIYPGTYLHNTFPNAEVTSYDFR